jgi:hypothetical protein
MAVSIPEIMEQIKNKVFGNRKNACLRLPAAIGGTRACGIGGGSPMAGFHPAQH